MTTFRRTACILAPLVAIGGIASSASAQTPLRDRVAAAVEAVQSACAAEVSKFCGSVTPGEGRVLLCMQAHEDQLGIRCQFALYRASRNLERTLHRVERIADACWSDIQKQCADSDNIRQCVMEKGPALSPACRTVVSGLRRVAQGVASLKGLPAYSADGKNLGNVVEVTRGPDGKVQAVQIEVGRFLGLGNRIVTIDAAAVEQLADRVRLRLNGDAVRSLPEAQKQ
jgi:Golgi apparatus protein 1